MDQPTQDKGLKAWIGRQSAFLSAIYYAVGITAFGVAAVTALVNFTNRSNKSHIASNPVQPLGGWIPIPEHVLQVLIDYRWPILAFCAFVVGGVVALHISRLKRRLASIAPVDEVARLYAEILTEIRTFPENGDMRALSVEINRFLVHTLNRISVLYSEYTGSPSHVTLKFLDGPNKRIRTVARGQTSTDDRGSIDEAMQWYPYQDNTAFTEILTDPNRAFYLSNDLRREARRGRYKNARPDWQSYYRACLVVPITVATHAAAIDERSVWGFLTVDNRGGGFDATCGCSLLKSFGRMYYYLLGELSVIPVAGIASATSNPAEGRVPSS